MDAKLAKTLRHEMCLIGLICLYLTVSKAKQLLSFCYKGLCAICWLIFKILVHTKNHRWRKNLNTDS